MAFASIHFQGIQISAKMATNLHTIWLAGNQLHNLQHVIDLLSAVLGPWLADGLGKGFHKEVHISWPRVPDRTE